MPRLHHSLVRLFVATGGLIVLAATSAAAQQARLVGKVTDAASGAGIGGARLLIGGTSQVETTGADGSFQFRSVTPGARSIRVVAIGFEAQVKPVTLAAGETVTLDFAMKAVAAQLDEIVTTATGQQSKLEIGNSIATIDVKKVVEEAPITEFANLISGRAAGVSVLKSSGATGTGTRFRIRGSNSISLSNEPLYYVDGIRIDADPNAFSYGIGGQSTSRINDINPDDIENIEIVKGPSAATLYGIQAANGVVLITTKRGSAGKPRWNVFTEQGAVVDNNTYRTNYFGRSTDPNFDPYCTLLLVAQGDCTQSSVDKYNPLNDRVQKPLAPGYRRQYGVNVAGGSDALTYYVGADFEGEQGVYKLRGFDFDSTATAFGGTVPRDQLRPNTLNKLSLRANTQAKITPNADVAVNIGFVSSQLRLVENDNTLNSVIGSGDGAGVPQDISRGWYIVPAQVFAERNRQGISRLTSGLTANWRPRSWLATRATFGYDVTNSQDTQFWPTGQLADFAYPVQNLGEISQQRNQTSQLSADLLMATNYRLSPSLTGKTSVGGQFFKNLKTGTFARGRGLAEGATAISGASTSEAQDLSIETRSAGGFIEQQLGVQDKLFLTAGLRLDKNSAFGKNFSTRPLPKVSASWLVKDDATASVLRTVRFRTAYGQSTQQPGSNDARFFFNQVPGKLVGAPVVGVSIANLGNPDLKPERSQEIESGVDASLFRGRLSVEATFFYKRTDDALILREISPSLGTTYTQFFNIGRTSNRGLELKLDGRLIESRNFELDMTLTGSLIKNKLDSRGADTTAITVGFNQLHVVGYPLGGFWDRPLTGFADANGNGIIEPGEYTIGAEKVFRGAPLPTRELSLNTGASLLGGRFRITSQFDYRGGQIVDNQTESFRCSGGIIYCRGLVDPTAPLAQQAAAAAATYGDNTGITQWGFFEKGQFVKLRELSVTYNAPANVARAIGSSRASITLSGRNLWTITKYSGIDPEINGFGQSNFSSTDFFSQPQVRYWVARVNLSF